MKTGLVVVLSGWLFLAIGWFFYLLVYLPQPGFGATFGLVLVTVTLILGTFLAAIGAVAYVLLGRLFGIMRPKIPSPPPPG